jgi:hypothetical protein
MTDAAKKIFDSTKGKIPNIDTYQPQVSCVYKYPSAEQINARFTDGLQNVAPQEIPQTNDVVSTVEHDGRPSRLETIERRTTEPITPQELPAHWQAHYSDLQKGGEANAVSMGDGFRYTEPPEQKIAIVWKDEQPTEAQPDETAALPAEPDYFTVRKPASKVIAPSNPESIASNAWRENVNVIKNDGVNRFRAPEELAYDFFPERKP